MSSPANNDERSTRRKFLKLGGLLAAGSFLGGCSATEQEEQPGADYKKPSQEDNLAVWKKNAGSPYAKGAIKMPGICELPGPFKKTRFPDPDKYKNVDKIHGMCQLCSTVCGITGYVKDGRIIKIEGNKADPNTQGRLCARGQAGLNHQYHPERLLYPIKRVGKRGEGKWRRISWDDALGEIATRLKKVRDDDKHEEFAFHQGRSRSKDAVAGFLRAFGTNTQLNHRGLCSAARRAANLTYLFESDWDLGDYENSKYILNFGSNIFEAHQGHVAGALRVQRGRFENGAKLVTFDVRMSNTAGNSDEFFMPSPGTDGAVALAMAHTIIKEKLVDKQFFKDWANCTLDELWDEIKEYTPEWAEEISTVAAVDIARIAREFAAAAPAATTLCNRGSSAHVNGYFNDRAIFLLNVLVGSVGTPGGVCWMYTGGFDSEFAKVPKLAPKPKTPSLLADPPEFILANRWNTMRVGEIVYWYLMQERAKIQVYMTYNLDSPLTWPETAVTRNVFLDEEKINFHVCVNPFFNETASFADMVLPWTTFMERWDVDARGAYNLIPYISMRRPMVEPLGEARDIRDIFPELARRIGGGMEEWYPEDQSVEDYMTEFVSKVPFDDKKFKDPMDFFKKVGAFEDPKKERYMGTYLAPLSAEDMEGAEVDEKTLIITKDGKGIGIMHRGKPVVGFKTPSRKLEVRSDFVTKVAKNEDVSDMIALANSKGKNRPASHKPYSYELSPWPKYVPVEDHANLDDDQLVMTSFKWNVHNHGRTANLKWCSEIVHSNPAWIHPKTAKKFGLKSGDWIELTGYRSKDVNKKLSGLNLGEGETGKLQLPVLVTKAVHPHAIAISNSLGHKEYTRVAQARKNSEVGEQASGMDLKGMRDADWERNMWWEDKSGGDHKKWVRNTGNGWAQNNILPISPDYISGQQAFNDTVVRVKKLS
ncbi:MAG: thiosulfate reductase/polysulfide reductase chain A [Planctomycetota bacterium]|jgi:thiosulfate reductase/polysulfide reductase chain A